MGTPEPAQPPCRAGRLPVPVARTARAHKRRPDPAAAGRVRPHGRADGRGSVPLPHLVARARAAGQSADAATCYAQAFELWRGEPFATLDTPWINDIRTGLQRERHNAELDRADVELNRGRHATLVPALSARVSAHPLDERLTGQLMLALYGCGRQADALRHYHRLRQRLADELGADPTPPLRRLHEQILRGEPAPAGQPGHSATAAGSSQPGPAQAADRKPAAEPPPAQQPAAVPPPAQPPADVPDFTGRTDQLRSLDALLSTDGAARTAVVSAVSGTAGVGKPKPGS
jgi:hypothetical protein